MEKKSFKKLFLQQIFLITLLILGSMAFHTDFNSDEEYEHIKVLITASTGLQFSKEDSPEGRKIIYDCGLGLKTSGIIKILDEVHPYDMKSLIIKNCYDITIYAHSLSSYGSFIELEELKISNVTSLTLNVEKCWNCYYSYRDLEVSIRNVQFMTVDSFYLIPSKSVSWKLQNVVIDTLQDLFPNNQEIEFYLHLKNVKVRETKTGAFYPTKNSELILTIEDSHFENVHREAFNFKGKVNIINSTFSFLDELAFSINTTSPFIFSGNHVKGMLNPFNIAAFEVNIINNTFDSISTPWLSNIIGPERGNSYRVLNITGNFINHWSHNLFYLDSQNLPDIIFFEGNYLNCSCKNALALANTFQNYITEVFLNKQRNNVCQNFGNCPLHKTLVGGSKICSGTFRCPEDQNEDDEDLREQGASHLKSILSVLKSIDNKLDQIVSKYNSPLADN